MNTELPPFESMVAAYEHQFCRDDPTYPSPVDLIVNVPVCVRGFPLRSAGSLYVFAHIYGISKAIDTTPTGPLPTLVISFEPAAADSWRGCPMGHHTHNVEYPWALQVQ